MVTSINGDYVTWVDDKTGETITDPYYDLEMVYQRGGITTPTSRPTEASISLQTISSNQVRIIMESSISNMVGFQFNIPDISITAESIVWRSIVLPFLFFL